MRKENHNWINENDEEYILKYKCEDVELFDLINEDNEYDCFLHNLDLYEDEYEDQYKDYVNDEDLRDWVEDLKKLRG